MKGTVFKMRVKVLRCCYLLVSHLGNLASFHARGTAVVPVTLVATVVVAHDDVAAFK